MTRTLAQAQLLRLDIRKGTVSVAIRKVPDTLKSRAEERQLNVRAIEINMAYVNARFADAYRIISGILAEARNGGKIASDVVEVLQGIARNRFPRTYRNRREQENEENTRIVVGEILAIQHRREPHEMAALLTNRDRFIRTGVAQRYLQDTLRARDEAELREVGVVLRSISIEVPLIKKIVDPTAISSEVQEAVDKVLAIIDTRL